MTEGTAQAGTPPTHRELEVARAILVADSMQAAAARLGISEHTVRQHLRNLRARLEARNNQDLFYRLRDHLVA